MKKPIVCPRRYASLGERLIANSVVSTDHCYDGSPCWEWIGATVKSRNGYRYGKLTTRVRGKLRTWLAHRLAIVELKGRALSRRSVVRHLCNFTLCINPAHIAGGTQRQNVRQCVAEGRHYTPFRTTKDNPQCPNP